VWVPVELSRELVAAFRKAGGTPECDEDRSAND
jgi:hypothetical protein